MKAKSILLASVAGTIAAPVAANAADIPVKAAPRATAAPVVAVAPSWAGWYIGVHAGAVWHKASAHNDGGYYEDLSDKKTGFIGGGQIGYNMQSGNVVLGLEGDISGLGAKAEKTVFGPFSSDTLESDIKWMATARARLGWVYGNLLTFVTGGVAFADIKNKWTYAEACCVDIWAKSGVRTGPVFGGGFEYMFAPNWTGRVEGLWANFGEKTVVASSSKATTFKNRVVVVRGALNYKF